MDKYFNKTKKKIASIFAFAASTLIISATILTIFLIKYQMDLKANALLTDNMNELLNDYDTEQLSDKTTKYQYSAVSSLSEQLEGDRSSYDSTEVSKDLLQNLLVDEESELYISNSSDITEIQENHNIYSRVIDSEGYVLYRSDLFDNFTIDFTNNGFKKTETLDTCIYSYTHKIDSGEHTGTTLQTAQFCQITTKQQMELGGLMFVISLISSAFAYLIGLITAKRMLKPLGTSATQTKEFTQSAYHELLTPISVALSTAESSIKLKKYKAGIHSILNDLKSARESLNFLGMRALSQNEGLNTEKVNTLKLIKSILEEVKQNNPRKDLEISFKHNSKQSIRINRKAVELIFRNLLSNALKYTKKNGEIEIIINKDGVLITNTVKKDSNVNTKQFFKRYYKADINSDGSGLGLSITKSLIDDLDWSIQARKDVDCIIVEVKFN